MAELEAPQLDMQLVSDGDTILIAFEPPLDEAQKEQITGAHEFIDIPEELFSFRDFVPEIGDPFTEVNCTAIKAGLEEQRLILNEQNFAAKIADVLRIHGTVVGFDGTIQPIEQSGYLVR